MKKHFYSHLIEIDSLSVSLDELEMTIEEKSELLNIATSSIHHMVLDVVLSELSADDKKLLISHIAHDHHEKAWQLVQDKIENAEDKIKKTIGQIKKELHDDILDSKKKQIA